MRCLPASPVRASIVRWPSSSDGRNVGHPSTYKGAGTGIVRYTASTAGFELNIWAQKGELTRKYVSLRELCVRQVQGLRLFLADVVKKLEEEDLDHKREYRAESLASLFSDALLSLGATVQGGSGRVRRLGAWMRCHRQRPRAVEGSAGEAGLPIGKICQVSSTTVAR
jgi:hypothetical protein